MFGKINKKTVGNALLSAKSFLTNAYSQGKRFAGDMDLGIKTAKTLYSVFTPMLESALGPNFPKLNKNIMKGIDNYEQVRHKVMTTDEGIKDNINNIRGKLKQGNIDIGL